MFDVKVDGFLIYKAVEQQNIRPTPPTTLSSHLSRDEG